MARDPEKQRAQNKAYYAAHREEERARVKAYCAAYPERIRARNKAYCATNPEKVRIWKQADRAAHLEKTRARERAYCASHREEARARSKAYRTTHPERIQAQKQRRRASKNGAVINDFTHAQWVEMQAAYDHRCAYCGKRAKGHLTQDHLTPLSQGGNHTLSNIVPACRSCNSKKGTGDVLIPIQPLLL